MLEREDYAPQVPFYHLSSHEGFQDLGSLQRRNHGLCVKNVSVLHSFCQECKQAWHAFKPSNTDPRQRIVPSGVQNARVAHYHCLERKRGMRLRGQTYTPVRESWRCMPRTRAWRILIALNLNANVRCISNVKQRPVLTNRGFGCPECERGALPWLPCDHVNMCGGRPV